MTALEASVQATTNAAVPALSVRAVTKEFDARRVLGPIDLDVASGQTVAVLGANGSGKTTLLRVAAALSRPTTGHVMLQGVDPRQVPEAAARHLGVVTQGAPIDPAFTPTEQLAWWRAVRRTPSVDIDQALAEWGLTSCAHSPARNLSRGQRQRLALCTALAHDPPMAVLDEPFAALDPAGQRGLESVLDQRRGRSATLVALHDVAQAKRLADRVLHLRAGRLVDEGA